jgi:hypothetical protein
MEDLDANRGAARESLLWRAMSWSLGIAIGMVFLKMGAYFITGSAAILSDAIVDSKLVIGYAGSQSGASLDEVLTQPPASQPARPSRLLRNYPASAACAAASLATGTRNGLQLT